MKGLPVFAWLLLILLAISIGLWLRNRSQLSADSEELVEEENPFIPTSPSGGAGGGEMTFDDWDQVQDILEDIREGIADLGDPGDGDTPGIIPAPIGGKRCPPGFKWDNTANRCVDKEGGGHGCPKDFRWEEGKGCVRIPKSERCPKGQVRRNGKCQPGKPVTGDDKVSSPGKGKKLVKASGGITGGGQVPGVNPRSRIDAGQVLRRPREPLRLAPMASSQPINPVTRPAPVPQPVPLAPRRPVRRVPTSANKRIRGMR